PDRSACAGGGVAPPARACVVALRGGGTLSGGEVAEIGGGAAGAADVSTGAWRAIAEEAFRTGRQRASGHSARSVRQRPQNDRVRPRRQRVFRLQRWAEREGRHRRRRVG